MASPPSPISAALRHSSMAIPNLGFAYILPFITSCPVSIAGASRIWIRLAIVAVGRFSWVSLTIFAQPFAQQQHRGQRQTFSKAADTASSSR